MTENKKIPFTEVKKYSGPGSHLVKNSYMHIKSIDQCPSDWLKPEIDFQKYDALFLSMGSKPSSGYEIEIDKIDDLGDKIIVHINEMKPPIGGIIMQRISTPYYIASMPKTDKPVEFEVHYPIVPLVDNQ